MKWQFSNDAPIYSQLIAQIKVGIVSGAFPPGETMPTLIWSGTDWYTASGPRVDL